MTPLDFGVMFMLGLVSSLHCAQMCGPIVLSYSVALESLTVGHQALVPLRNHIAYNAGRILTYSALGAVAGFAGHTMGLLGRLAGFSHALAITSGGLMIVAGIVMLGVIPAHTLSSRFFRIPDQTLKRVAKLISAPDSLNRFLLGLSLGLLPCGLIYAALIKAMSSGSVFAGAVTMFAFGSGTAGALLAVGIFSSTLRMNVRQWGSRLAALGVTAMGVILVWRGTLPTVLMMEQHMHAHH